MINFKKTLQGYRKNLYHWFTLMDGYENYSEITKFINNLQCRMKMGGQLYFIGIGKNIPILNKVIATMRSLGLRAHDIDAVDIMHGDFGVFQEYDTIIAVSKSGCTEELDNTLRYVANHIKTYMVTLSEKTSNLENVTYIKLPLVDELDTLSKVPTTSPVAFQIFFDCVAFALADMNGINYHKFLKNHQNGAIGESLKICSNLPAFIPSEYQEFDEPSLFDENEENPTPPDTPDYATAQL